MNKLIMSAAIGTLSLGLAACADSEPDNALNAEGEIAAETGAMTGTAGAFPPGARIVEEDGVTYRIDPDGTRVVLGEADSRIIVEDGLRFRVDPDGTRVRIDDDGLVIDDGNAALGADLDGEVDADVGADVDTDGDVGANVGADVDADADVNVNTN